MRLFEDVKRRCADAPFKKCERPHIMDLTKDIDRHEEVSEKVIRPDMTYLYLTEDMILTRKI